MVSAPRMLCTEQWTQPNGRANDSGSSHSTLHSSMSRMAKNTDHSSERLSRKSQTGFHNSHCVLTQSVTTPHKDGEIRYASSAVGIGEDSSCKRTKGNASPHAASVTAGRDRRFARVAQVVEHRVGNSWVPSTGEADATVCGFEPLPLALSLLDVVLLVATWRPGTASGPHERNHFRPGSGCHRCRGQSLGRRLV